MVRMILPPAGRYLPCHVDIKARFDKAVTDNALPSELLHIVAIAQEAYLLFALETIRFKQSSVIKQHRLGQVCLIPSFHG